ncbi:MAG: hypothetical protein DRP64_20590, partial [Verrucomicrobia bacterium]
VRALLAELDASLFARSPMYDFTAWKQEFKKQIKPHPFCWIFHKKSPKQSCLPELNPSIQ